MATTRISARVPGKFYIRARIMGLEYFVFRCEYRDSGGRYPRCEGYEYKKEAGYGWRQG